MDGNDFKPPQASGETVDMVIEEQDPGPGGTSVASTTLTLTRHLLSKAGPRLCSGIGSGHTQSALTRGDHAWT